MQGIIILFSHPRSSSHSIFTYHWCKNSCLSNSGFTPWLPQLPSYCWSIKIWNWWHVIPRCFIPRHLIPDLWSLRQLIPTSINLKFSTTYNSARFDTVTFHAQFTVIKPMNLINLKLIKRVIITTTSEIDAKLRHFWSSIIKCHATNICPAFSLFRIPLPVLLL